jgi:hypothetical protein
MNAAAHLLSFAASNCGDWAVARQSVSEMDSDTGLMADRPQLLTAAQCLRIGRTLHQFESAELGVDFRSSSDDFAHWFESRSLFYAAICRSAAGPIREIAAVVSVFVANRRSSELLIRGKIAEFELEPWRAGEPASDAVLYFSTIICRQRRWLPLLYAGLLQDLLSFRNAHALRFDNGLAIASTHNGVRHLSQNGFLPMPGHSYLGRYSFMTITPASAKSPFWIALFSLPLRPSATDGPADGQAPPAGPSVFATSSTSALCKAFPSEL